MNELKEAGVDVSKVKKETQNYTEILMQKGVLVMVSIGYYRAQTAALDSRRGIKTSKEEHEYIRRGTQMLLPPEIIKRLQKTEGSGRINLYKNSFEMLGSYFVPFTALKAFMEEDKKLQAEFFAIRDEIVERYEELLSEVRQAVSEMSKIAWDRLLEKGKHNRQAWIEDNTKIVMAKIPSKEEIHRSFYWTLDVREIPLPSQIKKEALEQKKIRREMELLDFETQDLKKQIEEGNRLVAESERRRREEALQQTRQFLDNTVVKLRQMMLEKISKALVAIERNNGKLPGSSSDSLKQMIDMAHNLNFYNDVELAKAADQLDKHMSVDAQDRDIPSLKKAMTGIQKQLDASVRTIENEAEKEKEIWRVIGKDLQKTVRTVE